MNIVHLNSSDRRGGAALAAYRLHHALRAAGVSSRLLVQEKVTQDDSVDIAPPAEPPSNERLHQEAIRHTYRDQNRTEISNTHFSISLLGDDLSGLPAVRDADVIHLHWVASTQTPASLRRLLALNKPVVWTLHDLGPFTGGCHFPAGCGGFQESCSDCPQLRSDLFSLPAAVLRDKMDLWPAGAITLIAPSRWMAEQAGRSALFRSAPSPEVIPNGVDPRVFRSLPQASAREALGVPTAGVYLLSGAHQGQEKRKGFGLLKRVLGECARDTRFRSAGIKVLHLGEVPSAWAGADWPLIPLGQVAEEERVALAYAAADLFVLPSLEDNLPNMVLEALACGRPVVAFAVGGVPEVVRDGWNGRVVPAGDVAAMAEAILSLAADPERQTALGRNGLDLVQGHYSTAAQAQTHITLYERLLQDTGARAKVPARECADPGPAVGSLLPDLTIHCLHEAWQIAEADRAARGMVIEMMQTQLRQFESECAARLRVIEQLDAECAARLRTIEQLDAECSRLRAVEQLHAENLAEQERLRRSRLSERVKSLLRRMGRSQSA
jgi:glycosyltransferase involved in cell wall biosynthesis